MDGQLIYPTGEATGEAAATPPPAPVAQGGYEPLPLRGATRGRRAHGLPYDRRRVARYWLRELGRTVLFRAEHLVRNNRHAWTAARDLPAQIVGDGLRPSPEPKGWREWAHDPRAVDMRGRLSWTGLQWLVTRAVMISGEGFIVARPRPVMDGRIPIRFDVLSGAALAEGPGLGMRIGTTFDEGRERGPRGRVVAWHFRTQESTSDSGRVVRVPATMVHHVYDPLECELDVGLSWFTPVILDLMDLQDYQDATAVKQAMAAKLTVVTTDPNMLGGKNLSISAEDAGRGNNIDGDEELQPGAVWNIEEGRTAQIVDPARVGEYLPYTKVTRSEIAQALGMQPEHLSGDYSGLNYSQARMSRQAQLLRLNAYRDRFLAPAVEHCYRWASAAAAAVGMEWPMDVEWPRPAMPMLDPDREALAQSRLMRNGLRHLGDVLTGTGVRDPDAYLTEMARWIERAKELGLTLDSIPGQTTQGGMLQSNE